MTGTNCRPSRCKRDALPAELTALFQIRDVDILMQNNLKVKALFAKNLYNFAYFI